MAIVLGYDDSPGAESALTTAITVAARLGEPLVLVYGAGVPGNMGEEYKAHREAIRELGRSALAHALERAQAAGVPTEVELADTKPVEALLESAARHDATVIVVGTAGESPMRGAILGATPHKLLHLSDRPVLCVPAASPAEP